MSPFQAPDSSSPDQIFAHQRMLFANMDEGFAACEMLYNEAGAPQDYRFREVNQVFEQQTGLKSAEILGKTVLELFPDVERTWIERFGAITLTGRADRFEDFNHNTGRHYETFAYSPQKPSFFLLIRDITDRKRSERTLSRSETRLRLALEVGHMATWSSNYVTGEYVWDEAMTHLLGYPPGAPASYEGWRCRVHPEDVVSAEDAYHESVRLGGDFQREYRILSQNDEIRWVEARGRTESDEYGDILRSYGVLIDITERRRAEEQLRQSHAAYASLADMVPQIVWQCTPDGKNIYFNQRWVDYTGLTQSESRGTSWITPFHPEDRPAAAAAWSRATATGEPYIVESRLRAADGTYRWYLMQGLPQRDPAGAITRWFGTCTDIHDIKLAEQDLQAQRRLTETVVEQIPCCVALVRGHDLSFQIVNPTYQSLAPDKPMLGRNVSEVWPEIPGFEESCLEVLRTGEPFEVVDEPAPLRRSPHFSLEDAYFSWSMHRIELPGDEGWGLLIKGWETTARKRAEESLQHSQDRLAAIIGSATDAIITIDSQQRIVLFNAAAEKTFGYRSGEIIGQPLERLIPADLREGHRERVEAFEHDEMTSRAKVPLGNLFGLRANGERFSFEATISQTNVAGERLRTVILRDTTEEKKMEQVLLRNEKLASVGRIAASIAHEINNPLAAACNLLFLARQGDASAEAVREYIDMADAELNRIVHITRQSLGFYRESSGPGPTRVNAVLGSALDLLKAKIAAKKALVIRNLTDDVEITAVPGELRQVFCNLLANSLDAIDDGGAIRVKLSTSRDPVTSSTCVRITVADNGAGIPAATLRQVFEPFFTTKGTIGTGLGLWVSRQLVEKHHGRIQLRSAISGARRGTTLSIRLPL